MSYTNPNLPDSGEAIAKSSDKISILFGATYDGQPIPPLIVTPSTAQRPNIPLLMLQHLHQIEGHFGYDTKRFFNCVVGEFVTHSFLVFYSLLHNF